MFCFFFITVSDCLLLVYRNTTDFCILLYIATFTYSNSFFIDSIIFSTEIIILSVDKYIYLFSHPDALYLFFFPCCTGENLQYFVE